ncbi:MAG: hypothetical protein ABI543_10125 [Ignavibacteria bacterium]
MHDIIIYIFAAITILSVLYIAFSAGVKSTLKSLAIFTPGICGLLIMTNSQLLALIFTLLILITFLISYILEDKVIKLLTVDTGTFAKINIFSLLVISLLTALLTSLFGNTRWPMADIEYSLNTFGMILTKYLPFFIAISLVTSTIIPVLIRIYKTSDTTS